MTPDGREAGAHADVVTLVGAPAEKSWPERWSWLVVIGAVTLALLVTSLAAGLLADLSLESISRDPMATVEAHPLTGIQSALGVLAWWSAAVACLFAYAVLRRSGLDWPMRTFLLWSGLFTTLLVIDDQFMIHDALASEYLGLRERFVIGGYVVLLGAYLLVFRRTILRRTPWLILAFALVAFVASNGADYVVQQALLSGPPDAQLPELPLFLEDALKLAGIVAWTVYFATVAMRALLDVVVANSDRMSVTPGSP